MGGSIMAWTFTMSWLKCLSSRATCIACVLVYLIVCSSCIVNTLGRSRWWLVDVAVERGENGKLLVRHRLDPTTKVVPMRVKTRTVTLKQIEATQVQEKVKKAKRAKPKVKVRMKMRMA